MVKAESLAILLKRLLDNEKDAYFYSVIENIVIVTIYVAARETILRKCDIKKLLVYEFK